MAKLELGSYLKSVQGRKSQKQVKAAFNHIQRELDKLSRRVDVPQGKFLTTDDKGCIVEKRYGQSPGPEKKEMQKRESHDPISI